MVGAARFELTTPCAQGRCATRLRYAPTFADFFILSYCLLSSTMPRIILVAEASDHKLVGFLEAGLRSHADGCDPSHAVGFVEGWVVTEDYRHLGIGRRLLSKSEVWA